MNTEVWGKVLDESDINSTFCAGFRSKQQGYGKLCISLKYKTELKAHI